MKLARRGFVASLIGAVLWPWERMFGGVEKEALVRYDPDWVVYDPEPDSKIVRCVCGQHVLYDLENDVCLYNLQRVWVDKEGRPVRFRFFSVKKGPWLYVTEDHRKKSCIVIGTEGRPDIERIGTVVVYKDEKESRYLGSEYQIFA